MRLTVGKEREWGEVAEGLVGADGVVGPFPGSEFLVQGGDGERTREDFLELLGRGSGGALDAAIELGRARRQDKQAGPPGPVQFHPAPGTGSGGWLWR